MFNKYTINVPKNLWTTVRTILLQQINGSCFNVIDIQNNNSHLKNDIIETKIKNIPLPCIENIMCSIYEETKELAKDIYLSDFKFFIDGKEIKLFDKEYDMFFMQLKPFSTIQFSAENTIDQVYKDANYQILCIYGKPGHSMDIIFNYPKMDNIENVLTQVKNILQKDVDILKSMQINQKKEILNKDYLAYMIAKYSDCFYFKKKHILNNFIILTKTQEINYTQLEQDIENILIA